MNLNQARFNMVEQQIRPWNVFDDKLLTTELQLNRENFVKPEYRDLAYADIELPLPGGQKMLFPRIETRLLQELQLTKKDKVLEIGTGSGFVTAILAKLSDFVYSIEINDENRQFVINNLSRTGIKNVTVVAGDGNNGMSVKAPFDKIFVGGGVEKVSDLLLQQLAIGGKLVAICGKELIMHAMVIERRSEQNFITTTLFETTAELLNDAPLTNTFKF